MTEDSDYKDIELINVKMTREDYQVMKDIIKREKAYSWFINTIKGHWIMLIAGLALTLIYIFKELGITFGNGVT